MRAPFTCFWIRKCAPARDAICAEWVTQITCVVVATARSFKPIFWLARPLTPVSISSKIRVPTVSLWAKMVLMASIMRDSSPPLAILASGLGGSPGLVEIKNCTVSCPAEDSLPLPKSTTKRIPGISK